jgi:hypothetical protein
MQSSLPCSNGHSYFIPWLPSSVSPNFPSFRIPLLDPLTALSVAETVDQFVDPGTRILHTSHEIYQSATDSTVANGELWQLTSYLSDQVEKLSRPLHMQGVLGCLTEDEAKFEILCHGYQKVGNKLQERLAKLRSDKTRK